MTDEEADIYHASEDGDANFWHVFRNGDWFMKIQFNGEVWTDQQIILMNELVQLLANPDTNRVMKKRR